MQKKTSKSSATSATSAKKDINVTLTDEEFLDEAFFGESSKFDDSPSPDVFISESNLGNETESDDISHLEDFDTPYDALYETLDETFTTMFNDMYDIKKQGSEIYKEMQSMAESVATLANLYTSIIEESGDDTDGEDNRIIVNAQKQIIQMLLTSPKLSSDIRTSLRSDLMGLDVWTDMTSAQKRINTRKSQMEQIKATIQTSPLAGSNVASDYVDGDS